jgi:hypothetical protein
MTLRRTGFVRHSMKTTFPSKINSPTQHRTTELRTTQLTTTELQTTKLRKMKDSTWKRTQLKIGLNLERLNYERPNS